MKNEMESFSSLSRDGEYVPLASYALVTASWWREIFFGAALFAVTGGALVFMFTVVFPEYSASAGVAIVNTSATASLDDTFQAAEDLFQGRANTQAHLARRAALLGLVNNGSVVNTVAANLDWLEKKNDPLTLNRLLKAVSAELVTIGAVTDRNQSDLLRITFNADSPERSVHAVNIWAREFVAEANRVFSSVTPAVISDIQDRLEDAGENYGNAQMELEKHLTRINVEQMEMALAMKREDLEKLLEARRSIMDMLFDFETVRRMERLAESNAVHRKLETLLDSATALHQHVSDGGESSVLSNSLAVQLLKIQAYGITGDSSGLEISFSGNDPVHSDKESLLRDINSFIAATEQQAERVMEKVRAASPYPLREQLASPELASESSQESLQRLNAVILENQDSFSGTTQNLEDDIKEMAVRLESASARTKLLTQRRDLAYSNLETLQNEMVELQLTSISGRSVVRLGSLAVASASTRPDPVLAGVVLGTAMLPLLALFAVLLNSMGIRPLLRRAGSPSKKTSADSLHPGLAIENRP